MRPIDRGAAPQIFTDYSDAKPFLVNRLGAYCSFCERRIVTNLAVEHILPKDENLPYANLRNEWTNFLLSCVNCNSTKGNNIIEFDKYLLPDRDNTFTVFKYEKSGLVSVDSTLKNGVDSMAQNLLDLVKLNPKSDYTDKEIFAALTRAEQRIEAWTQVDRAKASYDKGSTDVESICREAKSCGFFSIWMAAFDGVKEVRLGLIEAFAHTASDCFDADGNSVSPRPANGLQNSGKS